VDLAAVAAAAADSVRPAAEAKSITIEHLVPEPTAAPALADLTVWGDAARLQQVVWNLLTNAIKFTPVGGRVRVVVARTSAPEGSGGGGPVDPVNPVSLGAAQVTLTVTDSGEGIAPTFLPHLFTRFSQADAGTTRRHGGLGLGLAIVRHLVELHGGAGPGRQRRIWQGQHLHRRASGDAAAPARSGRPGRACSGHRGTASAATSARWPDGPGGG